jgi:hypothetical protein
LVDATDDALKALSISNSASRGRFEEVPPLSVKEALKSRVDEEDAASTDCHFVVQ